MATDTGRSTAHGRQVARLLAVEAVWWAWTAPGRQSVLVALIGGQALTTPPSPDWVAVFARNGYEAISVNGSGFPHTPHIPRPAITDACMARIRCVTLGAETTTVELKAGCRLEPFKDS